VAAAALAIHDSEKITEKHYLKYFMDPSKRANVMRSALGPERDTPRWPKFGEILPALVSPAIAQQSQPNIPSVEDVSSV
jgi:hypothetical protein